MDYLHTIQVRVSNIFNISLVFIIVLQKCCCLDQRDVERIIGGVDSDIEEFPWLAQIVLLNKFHHCGGVIVSGRVVITAAHCLLSSRGILMSADYLQVYVGESESLKGTKYNSCYLKPHPKYLKKEQDYYYDLGLVLLRTNIEFGYYVQKAKIVPHEMWKQEGTIMTVAGFGVVDLYNTPAERLHETRMRYVNRSKCNHSQTYTGKPMPVPVHMFCMVGDWFTSDCYGDSGSGVMWGGYVVGIVNMGRELSCGSETMPSMYTDLAYFRSWIRRSVVQLEARSLGSCRSPKKLR